MKKTLTVLIVVALILLPSHVLADASLVQEGCQLIPGTNQVEVTFSLVNFSLPVPVCDLTLIAEPLPPSPSCAPQQLSSPAGWTGFLNPFFGGDWFALTAADCVDPGGNFEPGFDFKLVIDTSNPYIACCFVVQFSDPTGAIVLEQEECFCAPVPNEKTTWSTLKSMF